MGIDWFTFAAQIINFLILIGLLWRFAYKPIIRAMDDRESSIRERLDEARRKQDEADGKERELDEKHAALERQREDLLSEAREDAEKRRKQLMDEARQRVERSEAEWRDDLARQKERLGDELRRCAGRHVIRAARRLVADLAEADLESQIVGVFQKRLRDIDESTAQALLRALKQSKGEAKIVSAFGLSDRLQDLLRRQLADLVDGDLELHFDADDSLLCGVELRAGDQRVAWSAEDYLAELQDRLESAIASATGPEPDEHRSKVDGARAEVSDGRARNEDE